MTANALVAELEKTTAIAMASGKPLAERLRMIADQVRELSPEFTDAVEAFVAKLARAEAGGQAPQVGEAMPNFVLPDQHARLVALDALLREGPAVIAFLRGHWCPYCRLATKAVVGIEPEARQLGASFIAITPDRRPFTSTFQKETGAGFPVLTDTDNGYALSLGLAVFLGEELIAALKDIGFDLAPSQGSNAWTLPIPATFVLDRDGVIVARHVDPDYRRRIEAEDVLAAISKAAQAAP
ncbi:MAG TPA: peroxiredoxin [Hyphomonadaceae bacterium]|nr:peroxiredoxin [Hyphomonadaceae bacterium]